MKEFLRLDNKLEIILKIKPISPLLIKLSTQEKTSEEGTDNYTAFLTTESMVGKTKLKTNNSGDIIHDTREGEIYIPGSSLRGMFRERSLNILQENEVDRLYGKIEEDAGQKTRIFIEDAYLYELKNREKCYEKNDKKISDIKELIKTRSITPTDHFSGKTTVPLKFEYTTESFFTKVTINNISIKELKTLYFILRDSKNGELRVGNSKTRGFGQIELEIDEMVYYKYFNKKELVKDMKKYFEIDEDKSIKIGKNYLCETLRLKCEKFKEIDVENPNDFIKAIFAEVE